MDTAQTVTYRLVDGAHNTYRCSNCGVLWSFESDGPFENDMDYCPKCGRPIAREDDVSL